MKILQSYPLVYETLLKIHWFYKMKSQQIRKRNYQMNIIYQKERENKFILLEAMSFHSEVWRNWEAQGRDGMALHRHPQFLTDPLTLFQSRGRGGEADLCPPYNYCPPPPP